MLARATVTRHTCTASLCVCICVCVCVCVYGVFTVSVKHIRPTRQIPRRKLSWPCSRTHLDTISQMLCTNTPQVIRRSKHKHTHLHTHTHTHTHIYVCVNRRVHTCVLATVRKREIPADMNKFPSEASSFSVQTKNICRLPNAIYDAIHTG
jgi:hypothetical protein